jgi:hypothetical protein
MEDAKEYVGVKKKHGIKKEPKVVEPDKDESSDHSPIEGNENVRAIFTND